MTVLAAAATTAPRLDGSGSEPARTAATVRTDVDAAPSTGWHARGRRATLARIPTSRQAGSGLSSSGCAWTIARRAEHEQPLVVVGAGASIDAERRFLALASDAHDAAACLTERRRRSGRSRSRGTVARRRRAQSGRGRADTSPSGLLWRGAALAAAGDAAACEDHVPFAALIGRQARVVLGHRILVLLSKKAALDQDIEIGRVIGATHFAHIEIDSPRDLLAAENEFSFFFALCLCLPDRHGDRHQHHHHGKADEERRHRVAPLAVLTTL